MTQAKAIILRIRDQGKLESWEMTNEMFIQQYNARIFDARKILGCECKFGRNQFCKATEHIISDKDNHFIYINDREVNPMQMSWQDRGKWLKNQIRDDELEIRRKRFFSLCRDLGHDTEKAKERAKKRYGVEHFIDLNLTQVNELIDLLEGQKIFKQDKEIYDTLAQASA
jgi:hypothetical protein